MQRRTSRARRIAWVVAACASLTACGNRAGAAASDAGADRSMTLTDAPSDDVSTPADAPSDGAEAGPPGRAGPCGNLPVVTRVSHSAPPLAIAGDPGTPADAGPSLGIYDPSLVYPVGAPAGVLSYSTTALDDVHTRIAMTTDHGHSYTFVVEPNHAEPITISTSDTSVCGSSTCAAVAWHEVSSIVADGSDPDASRLYKLFVHTYASLAGGATLRRDWGYIGLYTAPAPGGPWSAETPLLGWASSATLSTSGVSQVLTDTPALSDCIAFTEPGAIVTPAGLDIALTCISFPNGAAAYRVVLVRSTDNAATFTYVGALLLPKDEACLASTVSAVNGSDLFVVGSTEYLMVTPSAPITPTGVDYAGCVVIPMADVVSGTVARGPMGAPEVVRWLAADDGRFTGPCTFAEGATASGYMVPMHSPPPPPIFGIFTSGIGAP